MKRPLVPLCCIVFLSALAALGNAQPPATGKDGRFRTKVSYLPGLCEA